MCRSQVKSLLLVQAEVESSSVFELSRNILIWNARQSSKTTTQPFPFQSAYHWHWQNNVVLVTARKRVHFVV